MAKLIIDGVKYYDTLQGYWISDPVENGSRLCIWPHYQSEGDRLKQWEFYRKDRNVANKSASAKKLAILLFINEYKITGIIDPILAPALAAYDAMKAKEIELDKARDKFDAIVKDLDDSALYQKK